MRIYKWPTGIWKKKKQITAINHQKNPYWKHNEILPCHLLRWLLNSNNNNNKITNKRHKCWEGCQSLAHSFLECKIVQLQWKAVWSCYKNFNFVEILQNLKNSTKLKSKTTFHIVLGKRIIWPLWQCSQGNK